MKLRAILVSWIVGTTAALAFSGCPGETAKPKPDDEECDDPKDGGPDDPDGGSGEDTTPPTVTGASPSGTLPPGTTSTTLSATTNEAATCKHDGADVDYDSMAEAFSGDGTSHEATLTGLQDSVSYTRYVRCSDTAGNAATSSFALSFRVAGGVATILWTDDIQGSSAMFGFNGLGIEHPIGTGVTASDANGANVSREADPLGGGGFAMRHFGVLDEGGARAQAGLYGDQTVELGEQAAQPEGVWVAQEWYFPEALDAGGDPYPWMNVWDWHSVTAQRSDRWHTAPGLMVARDGSMELELTWGSPPGGLNGGPTRSTIAMPVGRWFDIEMHYEWVDTPTGTIQVWIDGELAIERTGVQTRGAGHAIVETYMKLYGSTQGATPWEPTPTVKYTRNVRIAGERIWR